MRWYRATLHACGALAAAVIGLVVLLVCADVAARNLKWGSLPWVVEVTEYSLPLATLLAAPWLLYRNEHVHIDIALGRLPAAVRREVARFVAILSALVCITLVWYSIRVIADSRQIGALVMKSLVFPEWWLFVPLPICFALMAIECARRVRSPAPPPA